MLGLGNSQLVPAQTVTISGSSASHPLTHPVLVWAVPGPLVGTSDFNKERAAGALVDIIVVNESPVHCAIVAQQLLSPFS